VKAMEKLNEREETILKIVVDEYTANSEPVGSRSVSKKGLINLSPASIRNIMSDLEELGYIFQPHTSAGRIPTDKGYRYYIDKFVQFEKPDARILEQISLFNNLPNINSLFKEISYKLGTLTHSVGFIAAPKLQTMHLKHIEFLRLNNESVIAIIVTKSGIVHNALLNIDKSIKDNDLIQISNYLNEHFKDKTLQDIKNHIEMEVRSKKAEFDCLVANLIKMGSNLFKEPDFDGELIFEGTNNFLEIPEFQDIDKLKEMLNIFEEKTFIYNILDKCINENGVQVFVGSEIGNEKASEFGIVAKSYKRGGKTVGTLGVIGPKRMKYSKVVSIVDYTADIISNVLNRLVGIK
jgi:heat-inducible transcriptional repressor